MRIRRITTLMFVLSIGLLTLGLSACDQIQQLLVPAPSETPPEMERLEIPIGVVLSMTGRLSSTFGVPIGNAFELALEEVNNSRLRGRRPSSLS